MDPTTQTRPVTSFNDPIAEPAATGVPTFQPVHSSATTSTTSTQTPTSTLETPGERPEAHRSETSPEEHVDKLANGIAGAVLAAPMAAIEALSPNAATKISEAGAALSTHASTLSSSVASGVQSLRENPTAQQYASVGAEHASNLSSQAADYAGKAAQSVRDNVNDKGVYGATTDAATAAREGVVGAAAVAKETVLSYLPESVGGTAGATKTEGIKGVQTGEGPEWVRHEGGIAAVPASSTTTATSPSTGTSTAPVSSQAASLANTAGTHVSNLASSASASAQSASSTVQQDIAAKGYAGAAADAAAYVSEGAKKYLPESVVGTKDGINQTSSSTASQTTDFAKLGSASVASTGGGAEYAPATGSPKTNAAGAKPKPEQHAFTDLTPASTGTGATETTAQSSGEAQFSTPKYPTGTNNAASAISTSGESAPQAPAPAPSPPQSPKTKKGFWSKLRGAGHKKSASQGGEDEL